MWQFVQVKTGSLRHTHIQWGFCLQRQTFFNLGEGDGRLKNVCYCNRTSTLYVSVQFAFLWIDYILQHTWKIFDLRPLLRRRYLLDLTASLKFRREAPELNFVKCFFEGPIFPRRGYKDGAFHRRETSGSVFSHCKTW